MAASPPGPVYRRPLCLVGASVLPTSPAGKETSATRSEFRVQSWNEGGENADRGLTWLRLWRRLWLDEFRGEGRPAVLLDVRVPLVGVAARATTGKEDTLRAPESLSSCLGFCSFLPNHSLAVRRVLPPPLRQLVLHLELRPQARLPRPSAQTLPRLDSTPRRFPSSVFSCRPVFPFASRAIKNGGS